MGINHFDILFFGRFKHGDEQLRLTLEEGKAYALGKSFSSHRKGQMFIKRSTRFRTCFKYQMVCE